MKAHRALPRLRRGTPFRPWLLAIVANEARNRRRSAGRQARLAERFAQTAPQATAPDPAVQVLAEEERTALIAAVRALAAGDQRVIGCRYFLELSERETAAVLGIPIGTVKSRLSRALRRLRRQLEASAPLTSAKPDLA